MEDIGYLTIAVLTSIGLFYAFDALTEVYIKFKTRKEVKRLKEEKEAKGVTYNFLDKKYVMVVTSANDLYNDERGNLGSLASKPWEGGFDSICVGNNADEIMHLNAAGFFYQLYENRYGERIGYGVLSYNALKNNIEEYEKRLKVILTFKHKSGFTAKMLFNPCNFECEASELYKYNLTDADIVRAKEEAKKWMKSEIVDECEIIGIELADKE